MNHAIISFSPEGILDGSIPPLRAYWWRNRLWLPPRSAYNENPRRPIRLVDAYVTSRPAPPLPATVQALVENLWSTISRQEAHDFATEAAILYATAKEYYADAA